MKKLLFILFLAVPAVAQDVSVAPFRTPRTTFTDPNGVPLANGCVFTYAGGTSTPQATYTDYTGGTPNSNPVILDSTGSAVMWLGPETYKFVAYSSGGTNCATGVQQWTVDQVPGNEWIGGTISGVTIENSTIIDSTFNNGSIGATTPGPVNATYFNGPIGTGGGTPAAGDFTQIAGALDAVPFSSAPTFNAGAYTVFTFTLSNNVPSSTVSGGLTSQFIQFDVCQDATGGWTFAWPSTFLNAPNLPTTANACITPMFFYDGSYWDYINNLGPQSAAAYDNITSTATPVFAVDPYFIFAMTLNQNVTSSTITGSVLGQEILMYLCQNSVGNFTFAWPSQFLNPPAMPAAPNACITPLFLYNGTNWIQENTTVVYSPQSVTFSATPTFNAAIYNQFNMTLTGNVTSSTLTSGFYGQTISFNICQDGTGGRTFTWPTNFLEAPTIASAASACTTAIGIFNGSNWNSVGSSTSGSGSKFTNCLTTACAGGTSCPTTSTYAAATTYTNCASYPVTEMVTATLTGTSGTGGQYMLPFTDDGLSFAGAEVANECDSAPATVTFRVPPGGTFSVSPAVGSSPCSPAGTWAITSWGETTQ